MSFFDIDEGFGDLRKLMRKMLDMEGIEDAIKSGKLKGGWDVREIDEPGVKGYIAQGRFYSDQPLEPSEPFEPLNPNPVRRPIPRRPVSIAERTSETREPLTDVFEEEKAVKVYVELPGEEKDDIQLNVTEGKVEVKTKNFYKIIDVPRNIETEKAAAKYNNGVLTVTIPRKEPLPEREKQKIRIE